MPARTHVRPAATVAVPCSRLLCVDTRSLSRINAGPPRGSPDSWGLSRSPLKMENGRDGQHSTRGDLGGVNPASQRFQRHTHGGIPFHTSKGLLGLQQAAASPAPDLIGVAPTLHPPGSLPRHREQALDQVGAPQTDAQYFRQAQVAVGDSPAESGAVSACLPSLPPGSLRPTDLSGRVPW